MYNPSSKQLIFIMYDGIQNSVFSSMVLAPLTAMLEKKSNLEITLITFEPTTIPPEKLISIIPAHDRLHVIIFKRLPFMGKPTLLFGTLQLYRLLSKIPCHEIIARGPLAGWLVLKTLSMMGYRKPQQLRKESADKIPSCTVQARGLCAEEYRYTYSKSKLSFLKRIMYQMLKQIEFETYRNRRKTDYPTHVTIEAVSQALKDYLIKNFRADETKILISTSDLIPAVSSHEIKMWREAARNQLHIPSDAYVYCYSGSYKPWQCAEQTIKYFADTYLADQKNYLLILSPDEQLFRKTTQQYNIDASRSCIINVKPQELLRYLAAADAGFLFREPDAINWVSRPTKMLEYQALGLKIIHNNTIAWLTFT